MDFTMEHSMKMVLVPGASKIVTFLPLKPGALPIFARSLGAPKPLRRPDVVAFL